MKKKNFLSKLIQTAKRVKIFAPTPTPNPIADLILKKILCIKLNHSNAKSTLND